MKKVLLVARDKAPSLALQGLAEKILEERDCFYHSFLGQGEPLKVSLGDIRQVVAKVDVVITGMSSSKELAEPELVAAKAAFDANIPLVCYGDLFGTVLRPFFMDLWRETRKAPNMLFVLDEFEKKDAESKYPSSTKVIVTGNPAIEAVAFPEWTREEVRKNLRISEQTFLGITEQIFMVLVPGGKDFKINWELFNAAIFAVQMATSGTHFMKSVVFLATHPGDSKENLDKYFSLEQDWEEDESMVVRVLTKHRNDIPTPKIVPGADMLIASGSTTGIDAAYNRIPVIDWFTDYALDRMEGVTGGRRFWNPAELGASFAIYGDDPNKIKLVDAVKRYMIHGMQDAQEKHYPKPKEKGAVIRRMADALLRLTT